MEIKEGERSAGSVFSLPNQGSDHRRGYSPDAHEFIEYDGKKHSALVCIWLVIALQRRVLMECVQGDGG